MTDGHARAAAVVPWRMRGGWAVAVLVGACGPVTPASDRVPSSDGGATTNGEPHTRPATSASHGHGSDDAADDSTKLDVEGSGDDGDRCPRTAEVEPLPGAIELLVDVSQTMATQLVDHDTDETTPEITRWNMVATALAQHIPVLADASDVGLELFPAADAPAPPMVAACDRSVGLLPGTLADELLAALPPADATFMLGATPMASAFAVASSRLQRIEQGRPGAIVVLTDGVPNCDPAEAPPALFQNVDDGARQWAEYELVMGRTTHVVAVDVQAGPVTGGGPEADPLGDHLTTLQYIASAGGTGLWIANDAASLDGALAAIVQATTSCRARVPVLLFGDWALVHVDGLTYYEVGIDQCPVTDGFARVGGEGATIELCGNACAAFRATGTATVEEICAIAE